MLKRLNVFLCSCCLGMLCATQAGAAKDLKLNLSKAGKERDQAHVKQVEQQFLTDNDTLMQKYMREFGGGDYNIAVCRDLDKQLSSRGLKATPEMKKCREQFMIDLHTLKREKEHVLFYCIDNDKPLMTGFFTKGRKPGKPVPKK